MAERKKTKAKDGERPRDRVFAILEFVAAQARSCSATEIGAGLGLPTATAHRMALQLEAGGYLVRFLGSKRFIAGPRLTQMALRVLGASLRADAPHSILNDLAQGIGEHCQIGVVANGEVIYVDSVRSHQSLGLHVDPGTRAPVYCTSVGKLFLATLQDRELEGYLARIELKRLTRNTISDPKALARNIREIRRRGWAASNEEFIAGVVGCSVPIRGRDGALIAGLALSAPAARVSFGDLPKFVPTLQSAAQRLSCLVDA